MAPQWWHKAPVLPFALCFRNHPCCWAKKKNAVTFSVPSVHNATQHFTKYNISEKIFFFFFSEVLVCILKCVFRKMSLCCFLSPLCEMLCLLKCCYVFLRLSRVEAQTMYRCTDCKARWGNAILILGYMNNIDWIWICCFVRLCFVF